ncbi:DJ-1/PfpI family protein [Plantactinospora sp. WMMB334]|uniref:DJ-1/PfpI family protein n=1 Tax=Plantactinospora sp. WMMB334 TaxID=3404119 RepID=UPI003B958090
MSLTGRTIAVLAAEGYQELELWYPVLRAREAGADVTVVTSEPDGVTSHLGYPLIPVGRHDEPGLFDAVVVAGTVTGEPALSDAQTALLRAASAAAKPVYAVGSAIGVEAAAGARPFASADALPELMSTLVRELSQ